MCGTIRNLKDLVVYQNAFGLAMEIFYLTRQFPKEEKYLLTDQVVRSSRSICANLAEGWHKRRYRPVFICKLSDSIQEARETQTWLEFSFACGYLDKEQFSILHEKYGVIIAQIMTMIKKCNTFCKPE